MSLGVGRERLRAVAHPVRVRILSLLTGAALTAADIARELGLTHANASYHLRTLLHSGLIEVVGEERIRGGIAKRYRYVVDNQKSGTEGHRLVFETFAEELRRRAADYVGAEHNFAADGEFWMDPEVWRDVQRRIVAAVDDLHRAAQPPHAPGTVRTSTTIALFRMGG